MSSTAVDKSGIRSPAGADRLSEARVCTPHVDIRETEAAVFVVADMPGVDEESVSVDIEGSELRIAGTFALTGPEGYVLRHHEYTPGNYERTFALGNQINRGGIKAVVANGILQLTLPKEKEVEARKIKVKAA